MAERSQLVVLMWLSLWRGNYASQRRLRIFLPAIQCLAVSGDSYCVVLCVKKMDLSGLSAKRSAGLVCQRLRVCVGGALRVFV